MTWLIAAIFSYLILAAVSLVDKYLLTGPISNPKVYAFYVGTLSILILLLVPFVGFYFPETSQIALSLSAGAVFILGLFWFYKTLQLFEASRAVPAVGGLIPLFTFGLTFLFSRGEAVLSFFYIIAFLFLVLGTVLIALRKEKLITFAGLKFSAFSAFLLSLSFVLTKYIYLAQPFWNGFIWRTIGGFLTALCFFIFFPEVKKEVFAKKESFPKKTALIFLVNQVGGAGAGILQNWAIALAPLAFIAFINALQGVQYVFLFFFATSLSFLWPAWAKRAGLKEEISGKVLFQKIAAILLIGLGLAILIIF